MTGVNDGHTAYARRILAQKALHERKGRRKDMQQGSLTIMLAAYIKRTELCQTAGSALSVPHGYKAEAGGRH